MTSRTPPIQPSRPETARPPTNGIETYNTVAETIAGPSLRIGDNLIQAAIIVGCTGLGAIVGFLGWGGIGAAVGGVGMMLVSTLISGGVLMVLGWVRAARKSR